MYPILHWSKCIPSYTGLVYTAEGFNKLHQFLSTTRHTLTYRRSVLTKVQDRGLGGKGAVVDNCIKLVLFLDYCARHLCPSVVMNYETFVSASGRLMSLEVAPIIIVWITDNKNLTCCLYFYSCTFMHNYTIMLTGEYYVELVSLLPWPARWGPVSLWSDQSRERETEIVEQNYMSPLY